MTRRGYYPPSHRRTDAPQPEVCDVTGFVVPGADLLVSEAPGLAGARVSSASRFLAHARNVSPELDEINVPAIIGQGRVYEPGMQPWFSQGPPSQQFFTPQGIDTLALWLRQDALPGSGAVATWAAPGGLGLPSAAQASASLQPTIVADPFATDCRGVRFGTGTYLTLSASVTLAASTAFLLAAALRTPAVLAAHRLLSASSGLARWTLEADGSMVVIDNLGVSHTVAPAASFAAATSYVVTLLRDGAGLYTCRANGNDVSAGVSSTTAVAFDQVGDSSGGIALDVAETIGAAGTDYSDDTALLHQLERYLGYLVGVEL